MINIINKKDCCGCGACEQICPAECLSLIFDNEGFLYPKIKEELCIHCDLCERVCPYINTDDNNIFPIRVLGARSINEEIRMKSSSGGVFSLIAENVIRKGGVVFGVKFNEKWEAVHSYTEDIEGLKDFRGSKYIQSRVGKAFMAAERFLKEGRIVLFSGTPCQIDGLHKFLGDVYDNLLTVGVVCHGVPSVGVFKKYLQQFGKDIIDINFKYKRESWNNYNFFVKYKGDNGICSYVGELHKDTFMKLFLNNVILRPSCYSCKSKHYNHLDILLGDFWGVEEFNTGYNDDRGASAVLVYSLKGDKLIKEIGFEYFESSFIDVCKNNPAVEHSVLLHPNRERFFKDIDKDISLDKLANDSINNVSFINRLKRKLKIIIKR